MPVEAMAAGKDVYVEEAVDLCTVSENMLVLGAAVKKYKDRVVQVGTQQRAMPHLVKCYDEVVKPGLLGSSITCGCGGTTGPTRTVRGRSRSMLPRSIEAFCGRAKEQPFDPTASAAGATSGTSPAATSPT